MAHPSYTFAANDNGRNISASLNGTTAGTYLYNAFEQRVQKVVSGVTTQFVFDRFGHLLEEANASGVVQHEYIWLDDLPVAMVDDTGASPVIYFIHTDQLGTPQKMTDANANVVWDGVTDPFGIAVSLSSLWGTAIWGSSTWEPTTPVPTSLRFPGQYADAETALNQNWNRDYDPSIGRYIQSDPMGLNGGINTYSYAWNDPIAWADIYGLQSGTLCSGDTSKRPTPDNCSGAGRALKAYAGVLSIFDAGAALGTAVALEGIAITAVSAGCFNPTPVEPATCTLAGAAAGIVQPGAAAAAYLSGKILQEETLREAKEALFGCNSSDEH